MSSTSTSNPVTIANGTAGAAGGSVINVSQLVSQLVQATQAPQQNLINARTTAVTTQISAVGQLKSALSTFQSSLSPLDTQSSFNAQIAVSSDTSLFTATVSTGAPVGTYNVTVDHLASAQQLLSGQFTGDGTTPVGTGTLHLSLGEAGFDVTITSEDESLNGIAAAINSASGNPGITAAVLQGTDGAHLVLSSTQTGAANTIGITETDTGGGLSALTYGSTGNTGNYTQQTPAQDASFSISGVPGTSPSNTITTALNGVTLTLLKPTPTGTGTTPPTLSILTDTGTIENNIKAFVTAYNTLAGTFSSLGSFDATTEKAGPMLGDALLTGVKNQVQRALYSVVNTGSSTYNTLASIGITSNSDGTLSLDMTKLGTALTSNFGAVSELFSSTNGVATSLNSLITQELGKQGAVTSRSNTLVDQENDLTKQTNDLSTQMTALTASLTLQYSQLNTLLSSLQTTSAYLTQALSTLPSAAASKSS
jgi:flagellar hook-associated protein 2